MSIIILFLGIGIIVTGTCGLLILEINYNISCLSLKKNHAVHSVQQCTILIDRTFVFYGRFCPLEYLLEHNKIY